MPGMPAGFASGPPPGGSISPSQLASQAAYTVLGNPTAAPASPIATTDPVVSGSSTAARFLASANNTAAAPTVLIEPAGNSGLYWDATNGVVMSVDAVERIRAMVSGKTDIRSGVGGGTAVLQLSTNVADAQVFVIATGSSPEASVTGSPGDVCLDTSNGRLYLKRTGTGNTGWVQIDRCESGTYTPTYTAVTNLDSVAASGVTHYARVGDEYFVSGRATVVPKAPDVETIAFRMSLPFASDFAGNTDAVGVANGSIVYVGNVSADATNDQASVSCGNTVDTAYDVYYTYSYRVL